MGLNGRAGGHISEALSLGAIIIVAAGFCVALTGIKPALGFDQAFAKKTDDPKPSYSSPKPPAVETLELSDKQLDSVKVEPAGEREFPVEKGAVGSIDFNEDMSVQVFTPYQGKIITLSAKIGDEVKKGQTLFTIDSPDLLNAESTLIAAAGVLELTSKNLERQKNLYRQAAAAQMAYEQAVSDQQTAEANLKAARDGVRIFGKTDAEIAKIESDRKVDATLVVPSPINGRITARAAQPGLFVQPGNAPAPYVVTDISTMWMNANIVESDISYFHLGQEVRVKVTAYPNYVFEGKISTIGASVDPNTHRVFVRSEVADPEHRLLLGMYANFVIRVGDPERSVAVPANAVVREGDGTMTVWVTADKRHFTKRTVELGLQKDGYVQILKGLAPGELMASDGAIFLSNLLIIESQL